MSDDKNGGVIELRPVANPAQGTIVDVLTDRLNAAAKGQMANVMVLWQEPGDPRLFVKFAGITNPFEVVGLIEAAKVALLPVAPK